MEFEGAGSGRLRVQDAVADYLEAYARKFDAPIRTGVEVVRVERNAGRLGFTVQTSAGASRGAARRGRDRAVPAAGDSRHCAAGLTLTQIHSADYRNPGQLPAGAVLVVGAGSSGVQIADELQRAGREVYLSVGPHDRPPRRYRGRDFCWWLGVLGLWDQETVQPGREHVTIAVSGADGGRIIEFARWRTRNHAGGRDEVVSRWRRRVQRTIWPRTWRAAMPTTLPCWMPPTPTSRALRPCSLPEEPPEARRSRPTPHA